MSLLVILCVLFVFFRAEILLRVATLGGPRRVMAEVSRHQHVVSRKIFLLARLFSGMRVTMEGLSRALPPVFLVVSNHQSLIDIPALATAFPCRNLRYVAKRELKRGLPYISLALRVGQHALISRKTDYRQGMRELARFAALSETGICPVVFPEGTRSRTGAVNSFQAGAFRIVLERCPMAVLSVAVDGGYRLATVPGLLRNLRGARYRIKALTLYPAPKGKREIMALLTRIEAEITSEIQGWRVE